MDLFTILLGLFAGLVTYLYLQRRHKSSYPPCPIRPWPLVGNIFHLNRDPREQFQAFRKKCGDIYSLYFGNTMVVMVNGYELAKEAMVRRGDEFSDRGTIFIDVASHTIDKGILPSNGEAWKENRAVSLNILRNFGMGKNILAQKVQDEVDHYLELLESFEGQPRDVDIYTQVSVSNVMCSIIVGHRFDYDDQEFKQLLRLIREIVLNVQGTTLINYFPILRFLPGDLLKAKLIERNMKAFFDIFANVHFKENENVPGQPENYIAAYLHEMRRKKTPHLDESNLSRCIFDLFAAGTETSATTIGWFMLYVLNHPHVQEKIIKEIEAEVGLQIAITMKDKTKLPYLSAAILETQRLANLAPLLIPRTILEETTLGGYTLPKGAQFMVDMGSILHDKKLWGEDADKFRPERFMDKDGKLLSPPEYWIPFSHGRRVCLGEGMAKMELFLFISNIIQRFKLLPADENNIPPIKGHLGGTHSPLPYEMRFVRRN